MFVIMSEDQKCVVKGKSRKYLCTVDEKTRKELVEYETEQRANAAIARMMPIMSDGARQAYGEGAAIRLVSTEKADGLV